MPIEESVGLKGGAECDRRRMGKIIPQSLVLLTQPTGLALLCHIAHLIGLVRYSGERFSEAYIFAYDGFERLN